MRSDWQQLLYLLGLMLLILPAVISLRWRPGNKLLHAAIWLGIVAAAALTWRLLNP